MPLSLSPTARPPDSELSRIVMDLMLISMLPIYGS